MGGRNSLTPLTHLRSLRLPHNETISSACAIPFHRCRLWFYLRLTPASDARGLSLVLVIRGGLWLGECLDVTACRSGGTSLLRLTLEPLSRSQRRSRRGSPTLDDRR